MVLSENGVCCIFYRKESSDLLSDPLPVPACGGGVGGPPAPKCFTSAGSSAEVKRGRPQGTLPETSLARGG